MSFNEIDDFSINPEGFTILKYLIDNNQAQHISYNSYNEEDYTLKQIELDDKFRIDRLDLTKVNININELEHSISDAIKWLYYNLWSNFAVHGDLTNNNIIYKDGNIFFIDWIDTSSFYNPGICTVWFILADIIDFLNTFYEKFPELLTEIDMNQFNIWFDIIKKQEQFMVRPDPNDHDKRAELDETQCDEAIHNNSAVLTDLFRYLLDKYNINMNVILENNNVRLVGGKKKRRTRRRTRRSRKSRRRNKYSQH